MPTGIWHALRASCRESSQPFSMTVLPLRASIFVPARSACLVLAWPGYLAQQTWILKAISSGCGKRCTQLAGSPL